MYQWYLESADESDIEFRLVLNDLIDYTIGREEDNDIVLKNPLISRIHATLTLNYTNQIYLRDLGSSNGTFLNDTKIPPFTNIALEDNDLIGFGAPSNAVEKKVLLWLRFQPLPPTNSEFLILDEDDVFSNIAEEITEAANSGQGEDGPNSSIANHGSSDDCFVVSD